MKRRSRQADATEEGAVTLAVNTVWILRMLFLSGLKSTGRCFIKINGFVFLEMLLMLIVDFVVGLKKKRE